MDDGIVTAANSGSAAGGALERRRREEGRWDDLGLDLFEGGVGNNGMLHQQQGCRPSGRYDVWVNGCQTMRDSRIIMKNCIL